MSIFAKYLLQIFDMLTRADLELTQVSAILLAIHAIQRKQCVYIVQSSCPNLTQAWPGRESDASVVSKRNIRDTAKITSAIRDQSENREHKFTLRKHEDRHLV